MKAQITIDPHFTIGEVDPRMYGSFIEHLGRAVYDGIYCPGHPSANQDGFRRDVMDLIRPLHIPLMRYPGGNFVSAYRWEDSVGPKNLRPKRLDRAWRTLETNEVGLREFHRWCREIGADMMMAVNLGTRGIDDACHLLEYCNHPGGTFYSDLRASHGKAAPYGIKTWCLGNEMDGPWQIGHKTAEEYGRLAVETARAMRKIDPTIQLVATGSSYPEMPTFPQWEATVLEHTYADVDYLSLHQYLGDTTNDMGDYLAKSLTTEYFIRSVLSTCDYVKAKKREKKPMYLSFDEWNIWYHTLGQDDELMKNHPWQKGPRLVEDIYTLADAVVFGTMLMTLLNHADRVKIACLAQLVNVLAPVFTEPDGGSAWVQTIYWPFYYTSRYGHGTVLSTPLSCPKYDSKSFSGVPYLESATIYNEATGELTIMAANRSLEEPVVLTGSLGAFTSAQLLEHVILTGDDPYAVNSAAQAAVVPQREDRTSMDDRGFTASLPPLSWNMIRFQVSAR